MPVRLFILGLLKQRDSHGYEIKERIKEWGMEDWADIGWSSIYHALKKMESEGFLEEKDTLQEGSRPPKSVYCITPKGEIEFLRLLRENTVFISKDKNPIYISLLYIRELPAEERLRLLKERLEGLRNSQAIVEKKLQYIQQSNAYGDSSLSLERDIMHREAEIKWMEKVITKYENE